MDKIDIELLWALKELSSSSEPVELEDMIKKSKALSKNDNLTEKLETMKNDGLIDASNSSENTLSYLLQKRR